MERHRARLERELLDALPGILTRGVSRSDETEMQPAAPMVERLLYTTYEFSSLARAAFLAWAAQPHVPTAPRVIIGSRAGGGPAVEGED